MDGAVAWYTGLTLKKKIPVSVVLFGVARVIIAWLMRKLLKRPPQPFSLPILGNMYLLPEPNPNPTKKPGVHKVMTKLSETYGPVMGMWFGSQYTVVIGNWKAAYEATKTRGDDFAGRFCPPAINIITKGRGIALQNDLGEWRRARTALLSGMTMKQKGEATVDVIFEEIHSTGKGWRDQCGKHGGSFTTKMRAEIGRESLNVYLRQMVNVRFSDKLTQKYQDVRACLEEIFARISAGNPADYMPILRYFGKPKILGEMEMWTDKMYGHIRQWIQEHRATLDPRQPRDFLDNMLINQKESGMTDTDIEVIMWDVMAGGIDTTATTLEWLFYILCNYPETQRKLQEELDREIGPDRLPKYSDRDHLPYLNAVILELMRYKHFAPFGLPHMTLKDTKCMGYNIPKNTQVLINFHSIGMDPTAWKKPEEWRPERWLEEEKALAAGFLDSESILVKGGAEAHKFMPFGAGKRMCVGYGLGRVVMWCKVATHLHCFKFESAGSPPDIASEAFGVTLMPIEQQIKITPRGPSRLLESVEGSFKGQTL